jgi:hypothetical protein
LVVLMPHLDYMRGVDTLEPYQTVGRYG